MKDEKTREQLLRELAEMRQQVADLQTLEARHKQTIKALRESEEQYRLLFNCSNDVVLVSEVTDTGTPGKLIQVNDIACQRLGYTREELLNLFPRNFVAPENPGNLPKLAAKFLTEKQIHYEAVGMAKDGTRVFTEVRAHLFKLGERPAMWSIARDITARKQAEEALKRRNRELATLYKAATAISSNLSLDAVLQTVAEQVTRAIGSNGCTLSLWDPERNVTETLVDYNAIWPETVEPPGTIYDMNDYPASLCVLETGQPVLIQHDDPLADEAELAMMEAFEAFTLLILPLIARDRIIGLMELYDDTEKQDYTPDTIRLAESLSTQAAVAIENARLYQAAHQVDRLRVINELDQALTATLDPDEVAKVTLRRLAATLDAPVGALFPLPLQDSIRRVRIFTLRRGWTEVDIPEKSVQRLQPLLRQFHDSHEAIVVSGDDIVLVSGFPDLKQRWGHSGLAVPVWRDKEQVVTLALAGRPAHRPFTVEDLALAQAAAGRVGQAIQNARLYQASQERAARLTTLNTISAAAVSSLDLDIVLHQVLNMTCQALNAVEGSILLSDPDTKELFFAVTTDNEVSALRGRRLVAGQGIAGWVAQGRQAVCVDDVSQDARFHKDVDIVTGFETRSLLCAPLIHREKVTGVIEVINKREGKFTGDDLSLLEAVASIIAAALENTRLYASTRARANELTMLNEIGLVLTSTLDPDVVTYAALSQVQRLFQAERVSLLQPDPQTAKLRFVRTIVGTKPVDIPGHLWVEDSIAGWALKHQQPVLLDDAQDDPRWSYRVDQHLKTQTRALMAVPLQMGERSIGVIEVSSDEIGIYTHDELRTLHSIASTLVVALENARLYDELKTLLRERERTQAQMIHSEKMNALGRLVASLAHEINNPLHAIESSVDLILDFPLDEQEQQQYLQAVRREIERLRTLTSRVLDFARPPQIERQPISLAPAVRYALTLASKQLEHSHIETSLEMSDSLHPVLASHDHLVQVFLNLIINAIEAMPDGGNLTVSSQIVGSKVELVFADNGPGISPDALPIIFEPFYTTREQGTGLGLSVSYSIIQQHGGMITAGNSAGGGAVFTVALPLTLSSDLQQKEKE